MTSKKSPTDFPSRACAEPICSENLDDHRRDDEQIIREDARGEHGPAPSGRQPETAKNSCFAKNHQLHAEPPETAHHREGEMGAENVTSIGEPLPKTMTKKKRKPRGMIRLKNRNVLLRMARRMRIFVSVQVFAMGFDAIFRLFP